MRLKCVGCGAFFDEHGEHAPGDLILCEKCDDKPHQWKRNLRLLLGIPAIFDE